MFCYFKVEDAVCSALPSATSHSTSGLAPEEYEQLPEAALHLHYAVQMVAHLSPTVW